MPKPGSHTLAEWRRLHQAAKEAASLELPNGRHVTRLRQTKDGIELWLNGDNDDAPNETSYWDREIGKD